MSTLNPTSIGDKADQLGADARRAVRKASRWIVYLGRLGLAAKGMVYVVIGWLAIRAAYYRHGESADQHQALYSILRQPFGRVMLGALSAGLLAYMVWRIMQAVFNPERESNDLRGWARRAFRLGSGLIYGGLALAAIKLLVGIQTRRRTPSDWTATLMRQPLGKWLVVAAGLMIVGVGVFHVYKAWSGELKAQLVLDRYAARVRSWILAIGRLGHGARGVVFVVIGALVALAGFRANPSEAPGLAGALKFIERAPYGPYLLGAVGVGLLAYGLFQFAEARYRRIAKE